MCKMSAVGAERAEVAVELLRLTPRLVTEDGMRDRQHALLCIQEYQRFLTLAEVHRGVALTPSANVEAVWERHLLDTEAYFADSEEVFGAYAHRFEHAQGTGPVQSKLRVPLFATRTLNATGLSRVTLSLR